MAKPELGVKRACPNCGAKYYDLNRNPIICPKCGTVFEERQTSPYRSARAEPAAPAAVKEDDEPVTTDDDETTSDDVELVPLEEADEDESNDGKTASYPDDDSADVEDFEKDDIVEDDLMDDEGEDDVEGIIDGAVENEDEER